MLCADISGAQDEVAAAIGNGAVSLHVDVAEEADVQAMIATACDAFGRVDILVNNAGFGGGIMPLHEQSSDNWDRVHAVNLKGVFLGMKYGVIAMLESGGGAIVAVDRFKKGHSLFWLRRLLRSLRFNSIAMNVSSRQADKNSYNAPCQRQVFPTNLHSFYSFSLFLDTVYVQQLQRFLPLLSARLFPALHFA